MHTIDNMYYSHYYYHYYAINRTTSRYVMISLGLAALSLQLVYTCRHIILTKNNYSNNQCITIIILLQLMYYNYYIITIITIFNVLQLLYYYN